MHHDISNYSLLKPLVQRSNGWVGIACLAIPVAWEAEETALIDLSKPPARA